MNTKRNTGLGILIGIGALALGVLAAPGLAQEKAPDQQPAGQGEHHKKNIEKPKDNAKDKEKSKDTQHSRKALIEPGSVAPDIKLTDTEGKEWTLASALKDGKIVVLQWFSPECPFVQKHYKDSKTFNNLAKDYAPKGVVFVAINSAAKGKPGSGTERNHKAKADWAIPYPILLDESGQVGQAYGAHNTPAMVVINKDGKVAYAGAIDDDSGADKPGKTNYVAKALDELLAGTSVTTPKTRPYGCAIKYAKD